jgi:hypothetical protein
MPPSRVARMITILVLAALVGGALILLLARYRAPRPIQGQGPPFGAADLRPLMPTWSLRALTIQLLAELKLEVVERPESASDQRRLVATRKEPLGEVRYVVVLAPSPPGDLVDQAAVLSLAEDVKGERAAVGLLITPGRIETAGIGGLDVTLELIDGPRFRQLIAQHLPRRLVELDPYRGFGVSQTPLEPLTPRPTQERG